MVKDVPDWIYDPNDPRHLAITEEGLAELHPQVADVIRNSVTALYKADEKTRQAKLTDPMTGAANAPGIVAGIKSGAGAIQKQNRRDAEKANHLSVVFIDANDFGLINKEISDAVGDATIVSVANFFKQHLRVGNTNAPQDYVGAIGQEDFVGRKGGDEFIIVMHAPEAEAKKKMEALKAEYAKEVTTAIHDAAKKVHPGDHEEKFAAFQARLAKKYNNPALKNKPFEMTFSYGVKEFTPEQIEQINAGQDTEQVIKDVLVRADAIMQKEDKAGHINAMQTYQDSAAARINTNSASPKTPHR